MLKMYLIRKITCEEVKEALTLALEVFMQFEAPDYKPEGVETFKRDMIENKEFISTVVNYESCHDFSVS